MENRRILIVGCGFAGAVYARTLADAGYVVDVIDKRNHIGGNAFDFIDETGIRVHAYGPHLFHTKNASVFKWLNRFGQFVEYRHKVKAELDDGSFVPFPINKETINKVFNQNFQHDENVRRFLEDMSNKRESTIINAADYLKSKIGDLLTELFFQRYSMKMWGMKLEDLDASIVKRIPLRFNSDRSYFAEDEIQALPAQGYTSLFETMLQHDNIKIYLALDFDRAMLDEYLHCFNSMAIDEYFNFCLGELPYRSIKFHHERKALAFDQDWAVTNFTNTGKYTRETAWHVFPNQSPGKKTNKVIYTKEEPCDYRKNNCERYYPVKDPRNLNLNIYLKYKDLALASVSSMTFIGRCGTYQYLDMDQVINQSLIGARNWLKKQSI